MSLQGEVIDAFKRSDDKMETYSKKADEKMDKFLQTVTESVGNQLQGLNSTTPKMKEEDEDRYQQINERIANMEKNLRIG